MSQAYRRPMGATPYIVTVADLDDAMRYALQCGQKMMNASLDRRAADVSLHEQSLNVALAQYHELRADALPEILQAHTAHRANIAA
jgi:hypothetical protein